MVRIGKEAVCVILLVEFIEKRKVVEFIVTKCILVMVLHYVFANYRNDYGAKGGACVQVKAPGTISLGKTLVLVVLICFWLGTCELGFRLLHSPQSWLIGFCRVFLFFYHKSSN